IGKTLTAEVVAEQMRVPLYTMSAGDLGSSSNEVDENLGKVMSMVSNWNAVLLLDECDVFLEEPTTADLERNRIVSIFLRTLEYYESILFLTTNRIASMDTAFQSRIHLTLEYPNLDAQARRAIWSTFLNRAASDGVAGKGSDFDEEALSMLSSIDLNGRQIKNTMKMAQLLAMQTGAGLTLGHSVTPIIIATLNRPSKLNAITGRMITDLISLFETVTVDDRVKAVIVTGAGKAFSAGIDLSMDTSNLKDEATGQMRDLGGTLALDMFNCSKPVLVAYNGLSVGIGMTSTLAAAIRIAPRTGAEFGFPFARIGLTMESCSSFFLPRMVGYSNATSLLTTGKRYPADSSVLNGVFAELVDTPKDVLPRAIALAEDIITNVSPMAAYLNRQLIWRNDGSAEGAHLVDSPLLYDMFAGSDHLAFKSSFFNKRKPEFNATLSKDAPRTYPWWKALSVGVLPKARVEAKDNSKL
ncbi:hypothetical protein MY10362_009213, partial [Beauveria mimosiformis]